MPDSDELYCADEVFMTGTAAEVTPVHEVDNRAIGTGRRIPSPSGCKNSTVLRCAETSSATRAGSHRCEAALAQVLDSLLQRQSGLHVQGTGDEGRRALDPFG